MTKRRAELAVTLLLIVAVLVGGYLTSRIDLAFSSELETFSGPRAYPGIVLGALFALLIGSLVQQLSVRSIEGLNSAFSSQTLRSVGLFLSLLVFVLLFESMGYILTMIPLLVLVAHLSGARNLLVSILVSVGLTGLCLVIFRYGLATVLPEGLFGIDAVF